MTVRRTPDADPLHYAPDAVMHNVWAKVMHVNQVPKVKRVYWDTDGKQLK